jgi:hypothetical protein
MRASTNHEHSRPPYVACIYRTRWPLAQPPETTTRCRRRRPPHHRYQVAIRPTPHCSVLIMITVAVTELPVKRVWYRTLASIRRMISRSASPETSTTGPSYITRLPAEILKMIIDHLICDSCTLLACSLTCYSWYIIVAPHIHHTLVTKTHPWYADTDPKWPKPLRNMHIVGLLPFVKKFHIRGAGVCGTPTFSPKLLSWCTLYHFTALTNVQELGIDYLDIPSFIPRIRWYFGHFSLTVRSLALREPKGSRRQIIYFIGIFKHLEDLKLIYDKVDSQDEPAEDPTLVPPFIPPLRGRLTVVRLPRARILKDMIELFGGIRFRYMDLFNVVGTRLLLDACAETLETLRLYPSDPRGKELSLNGLRMRTDVLQLCHPFGTLIYRGTSFLGHSRLRDTVLIVDRHRGPPHVFSHMHCRLSHPLRSVRSPSFIKTKYSAM